ncbi:MAG TPA: DUF4245 domain-containing protein [Nakamurella multipartita]|nr:DUF4245 domain-containing protein [Nakamurella multipartita]
MAVTRRPKTLRDMAVAAVVLAVVAFGLMFLYGQASFAPGGPSAGQAPTADVTGGLTRAAPLVGFPVIVPAALPDGWQPNSFTFTAAPGTAVQPAAVRGGWLTEDNRFVTLVQSTGELPQIQTAELGTARSAAGTVDVDGTTWTIVPGRRDEVAWVRPAGDVTYLITGSATAEQFRALAVAADQGTPATT